VEIILACRDVTMIVHTTVATIVISFHSTKKQVFLMDIYDLVT